MSSRAFFPFNFAAHPWFVVNRLGKISRYEVLHFKNSHGFLYLDKYPPFQCLGFTPFHAQSQRSGKLLRSMSGDSGSLAEKMVDFIERSRQSYKYIGRYSFTGPNSNTYVQWILNEFPSFGAKLYWNAFGKNYKKGKI